MPVLKNLIPFIVCCLFIFSGVNAQTEPDTTKPPTSPAQVQPRVQQPVRPDSTVRTRQIAPDTFKPVAPAIPVKTPEQIADSIKRVADSLKIIRDSVARRDAVARLLYLRQTKEKIAAIRLTLQQSKQFNFYGKGLRRTIGERRQADKDLLFYFLCGLVLYFAILKLAFGKYLSNLFTLFFRVTMRQNQIRDQLLQSPLPSLLLNLLFAVSGGMYLNLLLFYYKMNPVQDFWINFSYCFGLVSLLYVGKLLILKTMGWIFNVSNATNTYLFIVFLVNKMIGIFLLPFLFMLAFPHPVIISGMVTLSYILLIALLLYRFIISYRPVRSEINVGRLHFIIYLCAFEIAPLLLIYKVLLIFVEKK